MGPHLFRILNFAWAVSVTGFFALETRVVDHDSVARLLFWSIYLLAAVGTFFDRRVAWAVCLVQLLGIWTLMGMAVSDRSFRFFTGRSAFDQAPGVIHEQIIDTMFGVLLPASLLIVLAILTGRHIAWILTRRPLRRSPAPSKWVLGR